MAVDPSLRPICSVTDCLGSPLTESQECLAHASEEDFDKYVAALKCGDKVTLRQTEVHARRLHRMLSAMRNPAGKIEIGSASFQGSTFFGEVRFSGAVFRNNVSFARAQFNHSAAFDGCIFEGQATFSDCTFAKAPRFTRATFKQFTFFTGAQFAEGASFTEVSMLREAKFSGCRFSGPARFVSAKFHQKVNFKRTQFGDSFFNLLHAEGGATFRGARFAGNVQMDGARVTGTLTLMEAIFEGPAKIGPLACTNELDATNAVWNGRAEVSAAAVGINLTGAHFEKQVDVSAVYARITLANTHFAAPGTIAGTRRLKYSTGTGDTAVFVATQLPEVSAVRMPYITTMSGTDLTGVTLSNLDLSRCKFIDSRNLDKLRLEGGVQFSTTPTGFRISFRRPLSIWWSKRKVIMEERHWRRANGWRNSWLWGGNTRYRTTPSPESMSHIYRSLRRAHEESKNEPGAADFYYGEMEMRRYSRSLPIAERAIIAAYWAVCGYGLRASRAIATLIVVTLLASYALSRYGFTGFSCSYPQALRFLLESAVALKSDNNVSEHLNALGAFLRILTRVVLPGLLGLSLLAVRNRVKR